jgi:hypothetical protein
VYGKDFDEEFDPYPFDALFEDQDAEVIDVAIEEAK